MSSSTMQALVQTSTADMSKTPDGDVNTMEVKTIASPASTPPPLGHVVLRVMAAALNPVDVKRTVMPPLDGTPTIVGYDAAGLVHAVASDVTSLSTGDRVFGDVVVQTLGPKINGAVAEYVVASAHTLAKMPPGVDFVDAAALPLVSQTALQVLHAARLQPGERVFVSAGAGGVGLHLMQIARHHFRAGEIATTASAAKTALATRHGANIVVDYKTKDAGEELKAWADVVVDLTGEFDMGERIGKADARLKSVVGTKGDNFPKVLVQPDQKDMETVAELLGQGKLVPVVDSVFGLKDCDKALAAMAAGRAKGKIVIKVADH